MEISRTTYQLSRYRNGKRVGAPFDFDSLIEARAHAYEARTPNGASAFDSLTEVNFRAKPEPHWDGWVLQEIRTLHRPGDPVSGVRVYA